MSRYDKNNDKFDLAYDEAAGYFRAEQQEHLEREQAMLKQCMGAE